MKTATANCQLADFITKSLSCTQCRPGHPYYGSIRKLLSRTVFVPIDFITAEDWSAKASKYFSC